MSHTPCDDGGQDESIFCLEELGTGNGRGADAGIIFALSLNQVSDWHTLWHTGFAVPCTEAVSSCMELGLESLLAVFYTDHKLVVFHSRAAASHNQLVGLLAAPPPPPLQVKAAVQPTDTLLVVDAMTGQEAAGLVKAFNDAVDITGGEPYSSLHIPEPVLPPLSACAQLA